MAICHTEEKPLYKLSILKCKNTNVYFQKDILYLLKNLIPQTFLALSVVGIQIEHFRIILRILLLLVIVVAYFPPNSDLFKLFLSSLFGVIVGRGERGFPKVYE